MQAVITAALAASHIEVRTNHRLRGLLQDASGRVRGAVVEHDGALVEITATATILASGGIGGLYAVTTTPAELKGEGLGLAALAGATIADPEFVQFHPTAIDIGADPAPLATEALRGEGAILVDAAGTRFMGGYHRDAELAPRDVVARAIHAEREAGRGAFLDARKAVGARFPSEFPAVFAACLAGGVDPRIQPIPIAPACHYHMGGIATDDEGRTSLAGLYAAGECASTGVHGANRLASNSLLEAAVFGTRAGRAAAQEVDPASARLVRLIAPELPEYSLLSLRQAMSRDAGVVRTADGLLHLLNDIDGLEALHGRTASLAAARLVAACALARTESRGGHFRADANKADVTPRRTFVLWSSLLPANTWKLRCRMTEPLPDLLMASIVQAALAEDLGRAGDVTSQACVAAETRLRAVFVARKARRGRGPVLRAPGYRHLDRSADFKAVVEDGTPVSAGAQLAWVDADARALLGAERVGLTLMGHLSGIATLTRSFVDAVEGTGAIIVDTRKTTPGLRALEKYAVRCGGGVNHRIGLDDAILIKDNHIAACGSLGEAVRRARAAAGHLMKVEVEIDGLGQLEEALKYGPDVVMLDNFSLSDMAEAVRRTAGRAVLEASGGVTLETVRAIARKTGVDVISVGALTHSASVLDIGLDAA